MSKQEGKIIVTFDKEPSLGVSAVEDVNLPAATVETRKIIIRPLTEQRAKLLGDVAVGSGVLEGVTLVSTEYIPRDLSEQVTLHVTLE